MNTEFIEEVIEEAELEKINGLDQFISGTGECFMEGNQGTFLVYDMAEIPPGAGPTQLFLQRMTPEDTVAFLQKEHPDALLMDGHNESLIGVCRHVEKNIRAAYSIFKIIAQHEENGMSYE